MGRRPHTLIQEFFDRGIKLDDNSNRYQHTCKRCGEFFPKGRVDSLTTHLLRRCSNLTELDRTWVSQQLQSDPVRNPRPAKRSHAESVQGVAASDNAQYQSEFAPPFAQQHQSALETLAEVSGQHSSRSEAQHDGQVLEIRPQSSTASVAEAIAEQALLAQLQSHGDISDSVPTIATTASNTFSYPTKSSPGTRVQRSLAQVDDNASTPSFVDAASAASQHLEQSQIHLPSVSSQYDAESAQTFQSFNVPLDMGFRMGEPALPSDLSWAQHTAINSMPSFGNLTMPQNDQMAGYGILSANARQKPRGRFDDVRRKEVSKIRKQGACIRCRMLKKPCSAETPCRTCASVESARIWKVKCLRTRLSEELTLWSKKLFDARAKAKVDTTTNGSEHVGVSGRIGLTFFAKGDSVSLPVKMYRLIRLEGSRLSDSRTAVDAKSIILWLLDGDEMLGDTLGAHARELLCSLISAQSTLMKDILKKTQKLSLTSISDTVARDAGTDQQEKRRSSYGVQNELLKNVLELWALTEVLTSDSSIKLGSVASDNSRVTEETAHSREDLPLTSVNFSLIHAQILAAVESRCSNLSKIVLNELERRLLQRQQTSRFATLLSALVLLNCVERMTGHYRSFDAIERDTSQRDGHAAHSASSTGPEPASWVLESPPSSLWPQGEHFADLLTSLLQMRALPPKTKITSEGALESLRDFAMHVQHVNGQPARNSDDEQKETAANWLDSLKLLAEPLKGKRDAELPGPEDGLDAWSLRYVARVLLPEKGKW